MSKHKGKHIWVRYLKPAGACTMWIRDKLVAYSKNDCTCIKVMEHFGGNTIAGSEQSPSEKEKEGKLP